MSDLDKEQTDSQAADLLSAEAKAAEQEAADAAVLQESRKHTRRSFAIAAAGAAAGWGFYHWIDQSKRLSMQPGLLRKAFQTNARLARAVFNDRALAPTYPLKRAEDLRVNGVYGLKQALVPESWRLQLTGVADAKTYPQYSPDVTAWEYRYEDVKTHEDQGHDTKVAPSADTAEKMAPESMVAGEKVRQERAGRMPRGLEEAGESRSTLAPGTPGLLLTIDDIVKLPKHELITQFKCIEGWSQIVHWGGVRLADLIEAYPPEKGLNGRLPRYVYMETPNGDYYVGYDMHVCLHPQTLLVTEMSGSPLTQYHGAPLRLHAPNKYGYKQIKRIGLIAYTDQHPDDYWTKLGYDWYAGL
jgi:Oxidoreductase molybdopterin binding domain